MPAADDPETAWAAVGAGGGVVLEAVELHRVEVGFRRPVRTARGVHRRRPLVFVRIVGSRTAPGSVEGAGGVDDAEGWGECAALLDTAYDPEDAEGAFATLERTLVPALLTAAAASGSRLPGIANMGAMRATVPGSPLAFAALEMAVADAHLRAAGTAFADLLGVGDGPVAAGAVVGQYDSEDGLVARVDELVAAGYARVKLKVGPGADVGPVAAVRRRHPDLLLQVDANESYRATESDRLVALDRFELLCIEQPFDRRDLGAHAGLAARIRTPVCLDESLTSPGAVVSALDLGACSVVCVKPARLGGIGAALETVAACRRRGVPMWIGGMFESAYARGVNAAVAALPGFAWPGDLGPAADYLDEDPVGARGADPGMPSDPASVAVPRVPGMGWRPDLATVERLAVRSVRLMVAGADGGADGAV